MNVNKRLTMIFLVIFSLLLTVNVALADAPVSTSPSISAIEDIEYTFTFEDFKYSDADGDDLDFVRIAILNGKGNLQKNGFDVVPGEDITKTELNNGRLKYLANADENGINYDSFTFLMFDDAAEVSAITAFNIDVIAVNDGPGESVDATVTVFEDQLFTFNKDNFVFQNDPDAEDTLQAIRIVSIPKDDFKFGDLLVTAGQEIVVDEIDQLTFLADSNQNGADYTSFTFQVGDGTEFSTATYTMTIDVTAQNDKPIVTAIAAQEALENVEFTLTVSGTDIDSSTLIGASTDSTWLTFEANSLVLKGTPSSDDLGEQSINVAIKDESGAVSEQVAFTITVEQGFEIVEDGLKVTVGSVESNATDVAKVAPGDNVTVEFTYTNHLSTSFFEELLNLIMGNVKIDAFAADVVDYSVVKNQLKGGVSATETFSFVVPADVAGDFDVVIDLEGQTSMFKSYTDSITLSFDVEKKDQAAFMGTPSLADDSLTCNRVAVVSVDVTNVGKFTLKPEFWVFDKAATINTETGVLSASGLVNTNFLSDVSIAAGATVTVDVPVDVSALSSGSDLFVYLSGDFSLDADGKYVIDDEDIVELGSVDSCLNAELADFLQLPKNTGEASLDLLTVDNDGKYIFVDAEQGTVLKFEVTAQSNEDLVSCSIEDGIFLKCDATKADTLGSSELTLKITSGVSSFEEKVTLKINPDLGFTLITINGVDEATLRVDGLTVKPLDELNIKFKLKNFQDVKAEKIAVSLVDDDGEDGFFFTFDTEETFASLNANTETSQEQLKLVVPLNAPTGEFSVALVMVGVTEDDQDLFDEFFFDLIVEPSLTAVDVSVKLADGEPEEVTCNANVNLEVTYTNTGSVDENDVVIVVKDGSEVVWNSAVDSANAVGGELSVAAGSSVSEIVPVTVKGDSGTHTFDVELKYNFIDDKFADSASASVDVNKKSCLGEFTPAGTTLVLGDGVSQEFTVTTQENVNNNDILWTVTKDDVVVNSDSGKTFTFEEDVSGVYIVTVEVNADEKETNTWTVTVTDKPTDLGLFGFSQAEIDAIADISKLSNLVLENANGKIAFDGSVDLSEIGELSSLVKITNGLVSVDAVNAAVLDKSATITLKNVANGATVILKSDAFDATSDFVICDNCKPISHENGDFVFEVDGFSTYKVVIEQAVSLDASEISFTDAKFGSTVQTTFTLKNLGSIKPMTNILVVSGLGSEYNALISGVPTTLNALGEATVTLSITVPADESAGKHKVGDLTVTFAESTTASLVPVFVTPESFLTIDYIKINGKTSGDLKVDEDNEIKIKISNDYNFDMEDVVVTVKILDVDGDDLEEDSDEFDIKVGKSEDDFEVTFDLSGEDLDEDEYDIEVTVVGEAEDGSEHETVEIKKNVDLDLEQHEVVIRNAQLSRTTIQCLAQTSLDVTVENIGKSNEDDVEIRVSNAALGINLDKRNIDLDKFSGKDNDLRTSFNLNVANAAPGSYNIDVEVFRDNKLEDTKTLSLTVQECLTQQTALQNQITNAQLAAQLQAQLQQQLAGSTATVSNEPSTVTASFRQSTGYLFMLGALAVLVFIALILAMVVMLKK